MATKRTATTTRTRRAPIKKSLEEIEVEVEREAEESPTAKKAEAAQATAALSALKERTVESAVDSLSKANVEINRTLSNLQEQVVSKWEEVSTLDTAIAAKQQELQSLFDRETVAEEITTLFHKYNAFKEDLAKERAEAEMQWERAQADKRSERAREEAEYQYGLKQKRQVIDDQYNVSDQKRNRAWQEQEEQLKKGWAQREEALAADEQELSGLRDRVAHIEDEKKAAVDKAVAIATNALKKDLTHEYQLALKDLETRNTIISQQYATSQAALTKAESEVERLRAEVNTAANRIVDISKSGFESVSGQLALSSIKDSLSGTNGSQSKKTS